MKNMECGLIKWLAKAAVTGIICMVLAAVFASSSFAAMFPIATSGAAMSFGFDGTNYLVGVENHLTTPTTIGAQLIDAGGNKVGGLISPATMSTGISANVAFDGTNYLLIWEYDPGGKTRAPAASRSTVSSSARQGHCRFPFCHHHPGHLVRRSQNHGLRRRQVSGDLHPAD